jgi:uncharacterized damage-inducible protein DinB
MDSRLKPAALHFALCENFFMRSLEGLSADELLKSPGEHSNCMLWIAGHLTSSRSRMLDMLGVKIDAPSAQIFNRGAAKIAGDSGAPGIDEILKAYGQCTQALKERLETLTAPELDAVSPVQLPSEDKSILGTLNFMAFHETYHTGQMAFLHTWLGKGQLVG